MNGGRLIDKLGRWICVFTVMFIYACSDLSAAEIRLVAGDGSAYQRFGYAVAVDGNFMAVGSPGTTLDGSYRGSVYIFRRSGSSWIEQSKLTAIDSQPFDLFGCSVAMYQDLLIVGAHGDSLHNNLSGAAYLFQRSGNNYVQKAVFRSPVWEPKDRFGYSVAVSNGLCAIGAPRNGGSTALAGVVYIYRENPTQAGQWILDDNIYPPGSKALDSFGAAVALSGDNLIVGASFEYALQKTAGVAYIYNDDDGLWSQTARLAPPDGNGRNLFGCSVDIDDGVAVVGAYRDDVLDFDTGSAYVYRLAGANWVPDAKLTAVDADLGDNFGYSVALNKSYVIAGVPGDNSGGANAGSIYSFLYREDSWSQKTKKAAGDPAANDQFGSSLAVAEDVTVVGAPYTSVNGKTSQGAVYVYQNLDDLALPVTLTSFTAMYIAGNVVLKWVTQSEVDNLGFIIQQRLVSTNWETIADFQTDAALLGRGSSSEAAEYQFIDDKTSSGITYFYRLGDVNVSGIVTFHPEIQVSVNSDVAANMQPLADYGLYLAFPNPFNPQTTIRYDVHKPGEVQILVYDMRGRLVRKLASAFLQSGAYSVIWDGRDDAGVQKSSGVYIIQLATRDMRLTHKVVLLE